MRPMAIVYLDLNAEEISSKIEITPVSSILANLYYSEATRINSVMGEKQQIATNLTKFGQKSVFGYLNSQPRIYIKNIACFFQIIFENFRNHPDQSVQEPYFNRYTELEFVSEETHNYLISKIADKYNERTKIIFIDPSYNNPALLDNQVFIAKQLSIEAGLRTYEARLAS